MSWRRMWSVVVVHGCRVQGARRMESSDNSWALQVLSKPGIFPFSMEWISRVFFSLYSTLEFDWYWVSTSIWASCVLNSAKVTLHPDANCVISVGQHQSAGVIVIVAEYVSADSREILKASVSSWNKISYFSSHYFKSAAFRSGLKVWQLVINYRFLSIFCVISNCMIFYFMSERVGLLQCFYTFVSRNTKYIHIKSNSRCLHVTRKFSVNKTQLLHSHYNHKKPKVLFFHVK